MHFKDSNNVFQDAEMITSYIRWTAGSTIQVEDFTSIGVLISNLSKRLAWEDPTLRDLADYYHDIKLTSTGSGRQRRWQANLIYSPEVFSGYGIHGPLVGEANIWNEWFSGFW